MKSGVSDPRLQKTRIRNHNTGGQAATVAGYAGPGCHTWPPGHIDQTRNRKSHPPICPLQCGREFFNTGAGERDALEGFEVRRVGNLAHGLNEAMRHWAETDLQVGENGLLAALTATR